MQNSWQQIAEEICDSCRGECCHHAHPPLSPRRKSILLSNGCPDTTFEHTGYSRLKCQADGMCIMYSQGKCAIHGYKPETCVSGPFTFDVKKNMIEIFLKKETICPLVRYLTHDAVAYQSQFTLAVSCLRRLIQDLPADELKFVLTIPEPETDLVSVIPVEGENP